MASEKLAAKGELTESLILPAIKNPLPMPSGAQLPAAPSRPQLPPSSSTTVPPR